MDKGTIIKELLKFSHLELAELLYEANKAFNDISEENEFLKASEKAALQSQKDSFEEQDKMIQELKKQMTVNMCDYAEEMIKKDKEISRLQGKVKEAWDAGWDYANRCNCGNCDYCDMKHPEPKNWEKWSNENLIK